MAWLDENHPIAAVLTGVLDRYRMRRALSPLAPDERLDGKLALVTGGASGLGFATSVDLARRGARVILADCRDLDRAHRRAVSLGIAPDRIEPLHVDLSDLASLDRFAADLAGRGVRLDRLVLNAAIVPTAARSTPQGLDEMFVVNYLSSFALVTRLLDSGVLPRDRRDGDVPRIVFVSSEAHRWSDDLALDHLDAPRDGSPRRVLAWYGTYKLMLTTFAWELARRLREQGAPRVAVFALCPGAMRTNIARELPAPLRAPLDAVMRLFFQDPFVADEPVLYLACARALEGRTAVYLHKMVPKDVDPRAADPAVGRALWERSEAVLARARSAMLDVDRSAEMLAACSIHLERARNEVRDEWQPDRAPPTLVMSAMAEAWVAAAPGAAAQEIAAVSDCIERVLEVGTQDAKDAVATGFLEAILAASDLKKPGAAAVVASLGSRAQAYCEAWNRFTGC